jgi:hypothetical protein
MFVGNTLLAGASRIRLKCALCGRILGFADVDPMGSINYRTIHPVSFRPHPPLFVEEVVDETGASTTREVPLEVLVAAGWRVTGPVEEDRVRFGTHRGTAPEGGRCRATPTVALSWLDEQVRGAIAAGQPAALLS